MEDLDTATKALQQAFNENGDVEASSQDDGQDHSVTMAPKPKVQKDTAKKEIPNEEAKALRKSDAEWQEMREATTEAKSLKEKLLQALQDAPAEIQQEEDVTVQVAKLKEIVERQAWEADHPVVKSEKYRDAWSQVNSDPDTKSLSYDKKWKLIKDDADSARGNRLKEELKAQEIEDVSVPPASKGSVQRGSEAGSLAQDFLKKAGFTAEQIEDSGVKL